ncbi:MAG: GH92 family glycosyl hydrolase [Pseudomonadota bacterium]
MTEPLDYVDPFIGVDGPGSTLCGPYHPLGLVRLGPDTVAPHRTHGYRSDLPLQGYSHTHVSGTGGEGRFGNVGVQAFSGHWTSVPMPFERHNETARVGYYSVEQGPGGIRVELTAAARCGVSRFTFPAQSAGGVMIDASAVHEFHPLKHARCVEAEFEWTAADRFEGYGIFRGGWGHDEPYRVCFVGVLSRAPDRTIVSADGALCDDPQGRGTRVRSLAHWNDAGTIELRIGVSFASRAHARASLAREAEPYSFAEIEQANRAAWQRWFDRIQVSGGSAEQRRIFHTFITRLLCMPTDLGAADEFHHWPSEHRHFSEIYCLWDSIRNANSLITLIAPELTRDMLNCLLDIAEQRGWLPDAWIAGHSTKVQGGSSADILFNEARLKGVEGVDYRRALHYMHKNNEVESDDPYSHGRYLPDYRDLGYVSTRAINCVSRHLEYAYQDWCTGSLALALDEADIASQAFASSGKVWNLWHEELQHFAPRTPKGDWAQPFDMNRALPDSWNDPYFYEGVSRAWSYNVQHDFEGLVARCGGPEAFAARLDAFFAEKRRVTKETFMHIPLLYHYAGRPDKSSARLREVLAKAYSSARNGLPDNEDMGCHAAFYICGSLGLYPMMGQDWYFLTAPVFSAARIRLGSADRVLAIEAPAASAQNVYIRGVLLDGKPLERAWLRHAEIAAGATLTFDLTDRPGAWGFGHPPPSPLRDQGRTRTSSQTKR